MDISERNRDRVLLRWSRVHSKEEDLIQYDEKLLARLCGFLAGDGSVKIRTESSGKTHHTMEFYPDDESLIKPFLQATEKIYGKRGKVEKYKNHFRIRFYSKTLVENILKLATFGIYDWNVPELVQKKKSLMREWLRAFFDAEAYVGRAHIKVQSVNGTGLKQVAAMLEKFGMSPKMYTYKPKISNWSKVYILIINRKADRIKFLNRIGFNHRKKQKLLRSMMKV